MAQLNNFRKYFIIGSIFWVAVDFTTAFNPDVIGWIAHMPLIWVFYLGSPLLFSYLIYHKKWNDRQLFLPAVLFMLVMEIGFFQNALLYTFPVLLIMVPVAIGIYSLIIYVPRWIVDKKLYDHKVSVIAMLIIWAVIAVLSFITRLKG